MVVVATSRRDDRWGSLAESGSAGTSASQQLHVRGRLRRDVRVRVVRRRASWRGDPRMNQPGTATHAGERGNPRASPADQLS